MKTKVSLKSQEAEIKRLAFALVGLQLDEAAMDCFEMVSEVYRKKKGKFDLHDACTIRAKLHEKHGSRRVMYSMDLLD